LLKRSLALLETSLRDAVRAELAKLADPAKAVTMQAYMKSAMPYYGVPTPPRLALYRRLFQQFEFSSQAQWRAACLTLWREARYREERYAAIALTGYRRYLPFQTMAALPMYEEMIVTGAWWDYVDDIASHRLGYLLKAYPVKMGKRMLQWSRSKDLWKRRSAILCQLGFKQETDLELLNACIEPALDSPEFFLQKAIGWALRQYAWTDAEQVRSYCATHLLKPLSRREALKNCG
jgi:3-methyladenine DNA glycosylase AlkD